MLFRSEEEEEEEEEDEEEEEEDENQGASQLEEDTGGRLRINAKNLLVLLL